MYCSSSNYSTLQSSDCSKTNNASNNCIQYSSVIGMSWLLYPNSSFQVLIDGVVYILWLSSRKEIGVNTKVALASNSNANSLYWSTVDTTNSSKFAPTLKWNCMESAIYVSSSGICIMPYFCLFHRLGMSLCNLLYSRYPDSGGNKGEEVCLVI